MSLTSAEVVRILALLPSYLYFFLQVTNECSSLKSTKKALEETILKLEVSDTVQFFKSFVIALFFVFTVTQ